MHVTVAVLIKHEEGEGAFVLGEVIRSPTESSSFPLSVVPSLAVLSGLRVRYPKHLGAPGRACGRGGMCAHLVQTRPDRRHVTRKQILNTKT